MLRKSIYLVLLLAFLISACDAGPSNSVQPVNTPSSDKAAIVGTVRSTLDGSPKPLQTLVWLARIYYGEGNTKDSPPPPGGWPYILDTTNGPVVPSTVDGAFLLEDINPGEFVLVLGDPFERSYIVPNEAGTPRIFTLSPGQVLDIGYLDVPFSAP